ncbi:hypothetical protein [Methanofollis fontis]|uniref:Uncharacterized protein n=1 Tax=Methanofollis fontis TaxID=2052832 RepID=A0A483CMK6_9EURY|nr:hypothetical protein [Methanofollis fontis]TAJ43842.1 hypothetical protein CUJ86_07175 [Methanofollis fontis]
MNDADGGVHASLFADEVKTLDEAINAAGTPSPAHVAICAEPHAGIAPLIDMLLNRYPARITHYPLLTLVHGDSVLSDIRRIHGISLISGCENLFVRRIGGFTFLEEFLSHVAASEELVITAWNIHAWRYLEEVYGIGRYFPVQVPLSPLDGPAIKAYFQSGDGREIGFVDDAAMVRSSARRTIHIPFIDKDYEIPWPDIDTGGVQGKNTAAEGAGALEDRIFDRLADVSGGNTGVAARILDDAIKDGEIRISDLKLPEFDLDLDLADAFILAQIISRDGVRATDLQTICGEGIQESASLYRLETLGLIELRGEEYQISPQALQAATAYLRRIRMVW